MYIYRCRQRHQHLAWTSVGGWGVSAQSSPAQWGTGGSRSNAGGGGVRGRGTCMLLPYAIPHMNEVQGVPLAYRRV